MAHSKKIKLPTNKKVACAFQGGGALGAYQAGIVRALDEANYAPDWFIGTSIGAINAAIAAGNPEKIRVEKMHQFWNAIATPSWLTPSTNLDDPITRKMEHLLSSQITLYCGQPGFFQPRFPPPELGGYDSADLLSYYDTSPLRSTLEHYIDFDRINAKNGTRLSVGAVEICSGSMVYFDSLNQKIGPEHIMASGALPPGFPAVEVEGKLYWDGGISTNSPGTYALTNRCPKDLLLFTVHLFDSYGLNPTTLDEVLKRKKDIEYSSRFKKILELYKENHALKNNIRLLSEQIPKNKKLSPEIKQCIAKGHESTISIVRFLYEADGTQLSSKDYEFSEKSINERIARGYRDAKKALKDSPWLTEVSETEGIAIHDMALNKHYEDLTNE
jgi:NTE family protein